MRCLKRNQRPFYYCLYVNDRIPGDTSVTGVAISGTSVIGDSEQNINYIIDEYGNETGERILHYANPVKMYANISQATGQSNTEQFGNLENYDKVIVTDDLDCPIDENSVLFIDKAPEFTEVETDEVIESDTLYGEDTFVAHSYKIPVYDYIVRRVAKSLNSISIAVSKVKVS